MLPTLPRDASKCDDYSQSAMFNSKSGHFRGRAEDGDYWQRVGLGYDRETRQMGHYFDVCTLLALQIALCACYLFLITPLHFWHCASNITGVKTGRKPKRS